MRGPVCARQLHKLVSLSFTGSVQVIGGLSVTPLAVSGSLLAVG